MAESIPARFRVIRFRMSKGDVAFEETVGVFDSEAEAKAFLEEKQKGASFRWPDWDEYALFPLKP